MMQMIKGTTLILNNLRLRSKHVTEQLKLIINVTNIIQNIHTFKSHCFLIVDVRLKIPFA